MKAGFDPELGRYVRKHIHDESVVGEGIGDIFLSIGSKLFGKTTKELAKKGVKTAATKAVTKTGEHIGNKSGDKIVQLLSKQQPPMMSTQPMAQKPLSDMEIAEQVNKIISGAKSRRRKIV